MQRLKRRSEFLAAAAGVKVPAAGFVLQARARGDTETARFGFTVSKKVGNAVARNRVRRRLREVVRQNAALLAADGRDYVLIGRQAALNLPFGRLSADFQGALKRLERSARRP
jgi:ribonuclease P protein component